MAFEFRLPDLAEGMAEGEIVTWKVAVGDKVALDQPVVDIMSDKATVEIPSPRAGVLSKQNYKEGEICKVGAVLFEIEEQEGGSKAATGNGASRGAAAPSAPAPAARTAEPVRVVDASPDRSRVRATPATRRLARQLNVDLGEVDATGPRGRVTAEDVKRIADGGSPGATVRIPMRTPTIQDQTETTKLDTRRHGSVEDQLQTAQLQTRKPLPGKQGAEERVPFRGVRRRIAENMTRSAFTATHFTYVEEVDVTELVELRSRGQARAEARGLKLSYLPFIVKAVVAGLKRYPQLNAVLDEPANEIVRKLYYHIGIAAQGPSGLMVTVVRNADQLSIFELAREIARLADLAVAGRASAEELTGSTFTISSLGKLGGLLATPIINFPEAGILGVHKIEQRPAVVDGQIQIRERMNLSISLDHRIVDGWDGAMFLQEVKGLLEDPTTMFMEMV